MKFNLYSIYDKLAEECGPVYVAVNDQVAARMYRNTIQGSVASEFALYRVGTWDSVTMEVEKLDPMMVSVVFKKDDEVKTEVVQ